MFNYNPYYPQYQRNEQNFQQFQPSYPQNYPQYQQPSYPQNAQSYPQLQGKVVDSVDVVKSMDINLDGSISYFPIADGTAIATKQLQADGTSKVVVYKAVLSGEKKRDDYLTKEDLENALKGKYEALGDIMEELKGIKAQLIKIKGKE